MAITGYTGLGLCSAQFSQSSSTVSSRLSSTRLPIPVQMAMARIYITATEQGQTRNTKMLVKVRFSYPRFFRCLRGSKSTDTSIARHTTDGADETDFATRLQTAKRNPAKVVPPQTASPHRGTMLLHSTTPGKISQPTPAFIYSGDGHHRSENSLDHPNDRPRAQHTRSRRSSQSNYEMASDSSYHNGPNAEAGRSGS
jgi:hypothetical protein